jgi:hypothetical protein
VRPFRAEEADGESSRGLNGKSNDFFQVGQLPCSEGKIGGVGLNVKSPARAATIPANSRLSAAFAAGYGDDAHHAPPETQNEG